jgi:hypothetical protein
MSPPSVVIRDEYAGCHAEHVVVGEMPAMRREGKVRGTFMPARARGAGTCQPERFLGDGCRRVRPRPCGRTAVVWRRKKGSMALLFAFKGGVGTAAPGPENRAAGRLNRH